ncbi:MAG TPA: response regulator [Leeuwenhoekiella sp.]|nr:response regulator [Leeuwenhoekiella sp.]HCQ76952.1 response regulator [Leeuwenhoekiella sp.]|tara:strand:+ start:4825 stop:5709 length:885 start_codon:yes stop_codon:yes gene_type:complete
MKLDYKILWLDDQIKDFIEDEIIEEVHGYLSLQGFRPEILTTSKSEDFFEKLDDSYDLILTDYHLNDINGDEVIKKIRSQDYSVMTEILFYTAKADLKDTDKISRVSFLETNTLLGDHREEVLRATINLIELTIKKFQSIVAMRGMIMHETSSLDVEMENILQKIVEGSQTREEVVTTIKNKFKKSNEGFNKKIDRDDDIESILRTIGASHRWRAIFRSLSDGEIKSIMADYEKEIILIRNKFAHAELIDDGERQYFRDKKDGLDFNEDFCKKVREDLLKHKGNIDNLNSELGR